MHKGRYWGADRRLYFCPEIDELRRVTYLSHTQSPYIRASGWREAKRVATERLALMRPHPLPVFGVGPAPLTWEQWASAEGTPHFVGNTPPQK